MSLKRTTAFVPDGFPTLSQFAGGYLHEDFVAEHGSAKGAREALGGAWRPASRAALTALFEPPVASATAARRRRS